MGPIVLEFWGHFRDGDDTKFRVTARKFMKIPENPLLLLLTSKY